MLKLYAHEAWVTTHLTSVIKFTVPSIPRSLRAFTSSLYRLYKSMAVNMLEWSWILCGFGGQTCPKYLALFQLLLLILRSVQQKNAKPLGKSDLLTPKSQLSMVGCINVQSLQVLALSIHINLGQTCNPSNYTHPL